jgi:hypothetical protein
MLAISWEPLPAAVGIAILSLAAASQAFARRVPNVLTLPAILSGWMFAIYVDATHRAASPGHALPASLGGSFLALMIMLPVYRKGLGAGCVKAQMAFAAWISCALPLVLSLALTASATIGGLAVTLMVLHLIAPNIPAETRRNYAFPAQVTMSLVAVVGTVACWMISYPA